MFFLDMRTVLVSEALAFLICAVMMVRAWRFTRRRYEGLHLWAAAYVIQAAAVSLLALRGVIPDFLSIIVANAACMAGFVLIYDGLARFMGIPSANRLNWSFWAAFTAGLCYFSAVRPDLHYRTLNLNFWMIVMAARCAWLLRAGAPARLRDLTRVPALIFAGFCAVNLGRLAAGLMWSAGPDFLHNSPVDTFFVLAYMGLIVMLTASLLLLVSRRLLADTEADLKRRLAAETSLREGRENLEMALSAAGMGVWSWSIRDGAWGFDARVCGLLGFDAKSFKGSEKEFFSTVHPDDRETLKKALERAVETDEPYRPEYRVVWPDGGVRHVAARGRLVRDAGGKPLRIEGLLWDITERKTAEAALRASELHFRQAVDNAPDAVFIQSEGKFRYLNAACAGLFGASPDGKEMLGREMLSFLLPQYRDTVRERVRIQVETGRSVPALEEEYYRLDGSTVMVEVTAVPVTFEGRPSHMVFMRDISARKLAESAMQTAQKLESLGTLAGGIAHDFNNLLTGITGNLSLIRNIGPKDGEMGELVREAETACFTAKGLARQLLTFASGGEPVKAPLDLVALLRESVAFSLRGSSVSGTVEPSAEQLFVLADRDQLFQVVNNLVVNAVQAMGGRGTVTLGVSVEELLAGDGPAPEPGRYARFYVRDSGPGIPGGMIGKIFDPYFSTKGKGRGLGLAVCRSIIVKHGGHISASSAPGKGSVFSVYLPLTEAAAGPGAGPAETARSGSGRVLIMDDEEVVYKALRRMLANLGYEAEVAVNGEKALEAWRAARAAGKPFAAVIMDLTIAGGMGGGEAVKRLKELDPSAKAIVSSGYADDPIMSDYAAHGFAGVLSKPYQVEDLARLLANVIG